MHNSWDDWFKDFIKTKTELTLSGFNVKDIRVNVEELVDYCKLRNIKLDGKARASFVREKE